MGLFTKMKRDYRNAGAQVSISLLAAKDLEHREKLGNPWFFCQLTGLELHNYANFARKDFLRILNEEPQTYRPRIQIPEDYWRLAVRALLSTYKSNPNEIPEQIYTLVRDAASLVVECAFDAFESDDGLFVYLLSDGYVWVERLRMPACTMERVCLGNILVQRDA